MDFLFQDAETTALILLCVMGLIFAFFALICNQSDHHDFL